MNGISDTYGASYGAGYEYGGNKRKADSAEQEDGVNEWMDAIAKRKEEIVEKVRKGETEPSIPIGAASFTYKQWNKLMKNVDRAIDDMQERVRAEEEDAELLVKKKKDNSITEEMLEELLGIKMQRGKVFHGGELSSQIGSGERVAVTSAAVASDCSIVGAAGSVGRASPIMPFISEAKFFFAMVLSL